jgi:predicted RNA-binding Zn ribbon-like protein
MKTRLLTAVLALTAMALLALNWATRRPAVPAKDDTAAAESRSVAAPLGPTAAQGDSVSAPPAPAAEAPAGPAILVNASGQPIFPWEQIESPDYRKYVSNLRAAGFPEELIRTIITADVDKLYEPREAALKPKPIPFDAPMAQRAPQEMKDEDWERLKQLRDVRMEKQALLEQVLGIYVPRDIMRSPNSRRNYESYEYALSLLPPEKREAVQLAQENEILKEGMQKATITDPAAELEAFKRSCAERDAALRQVLTPDEFDRYEMHMEPVATELARCTIGMEPTESEFQAMFKIASKNWIDTGGVYGRWRANPVPQDQIAAADRERDASLSEALGPERYLDYRMAITEMGQQMRNLAARFGLPGETVAQAFALQTEADQLAGAARDATAAASADRSIPAPQPSPAQRLSEVQGQLEQVLGSQVWQAWQDGRNRRVSLDP